MKVMLRRNQSGQLVVYIPKKDLEEAVLSMEPGEKDSGWGGTLTLASGMRLFVEPMAAEPRLPLTVEAQRIGA